MLKFISNYKANQALSKNNDVFNQFFSSFFDEYYTPMEPDQPHIHSFKVDILEDESHFVLEADLPGFNKDNVEISYENQYLTICAKNDEQLAERKERFVRREREYGVFSRSFYIEHINIEQITANFENGILTIDIPKVGPPSQRKFIKIK